MESKLLTDDVLKQLITSGFNPESLKKKLEEEKNPNSVNVNKNILKVNKKNPKAKIRLVPNVHTKDVPYYTFNYHFNIKKHGIVCLENYGKQCPICQVTNEMKKVLQDEFARRIKETPDQEAKIKEDMKEDWKSLFQISKSPRYYMAVIKRNSENQEEEKEVKFFEMSQTIRDEICGYLLENQSIINPINGHDFTLEFIQNNKYGETKLKVEITPTSLVRSKNTEELYTLLSSVPHLHSIIQEPTYQEIKALYDEGRKELEASSSEVSTESKDTTTEYKSITDSMTQPEVSKETASSEHKDIDDLIKQMMDSKK